MTTLCNPDAVADPQALSDQWRGQVAERRRREFAILRAKYGYIPAEPELLEDPEEVQRCS